MSDVADKANDLAEFSLSVALANRQQAGSKPSLAFCDNCGNPIPQGRRDALPGVELCVDCQRAEELRDGRYR